MINVYLRVLEFANCEHRKEKNQKCSKEERKGKSFHSKRCILDTYSPSFLALGLDQDSYQSDIRLLE